MNKTHSSIALVLDRSGSMQSCVESAITATNDFIREQRDDEGSADLSVTLFDDRMEFPWQAEPIENVTEFTTATYQPRGSTALLDAIGTTIDSLGERLAAMPENERPGGVIVAILTDGLENASRQFTWEQIREKIRHQEEVYSWEFLFLAAGEDAIAQAAQIGIRHQNRSAFANDDIGYASSTAALARKAKAIRFSKHRALSEEEARDHSSKISDLVAEEDAKRRK